MAKRAMCFLLTFIMTTSIVFGALFSARAEQLPSGETASSAPAEAASLSGQSATDPTDTVPLATVSTALFPALSVAVISNYFGKISAEYNEYTQQFTISYMLKASKPILTTRWTVAYDSTILKADPAKNTPASICPIMQNGSAVSFDEKNGVITFDATDLRMFDFTNEEAVFARFVFDVPKLSANDSEITKVDLTVEELWVSEPDSHTGLSLSGKEICLVANSKIKTDSAAKSVSLTKHTGISPSTYTDPNLSPSTEDEPATTIAPTAKPTLPTNPPKPTSKPSKSVEKQDLMHVYTGEWYISLLILGVLLVCSTILFIMRKRDIYND